MGQNTLIQRRFFEQALKLMGDTIEGMEIKR